MQRSVPVSCSWSCCGPLFPFCFPPPPLADAPGLGPNSRSRLSPEGGHAVVHLVIHKYIPPLLPTQPGPFLASPSPRSQSPVCCPLAQEALSFIHSFIPPSSAHVHLLTRKTLLIIHGFYQPHFGNRKRTIPPSGLTRKHTAPKTKTPHSRQHSSVASLPHFGPPIYPPSFISSSKGRIDRIQRY